jgi:hypothetical protein
MVLPVGLIAAPLALVVDESSYLVGRDEVSLQGSNHGSLWVKYRCTPVIHGCRVGGTLYPPSYGCDRL